MAEKHCPHVPDLRPERHADADLAGPLRRHVRNHAVYPHDAEEQCDGRGDGQHRHGKRCLDHGASLNFVECLHRCERQIWIDRPDGLLDFMHEARSTHAARPDRVGHRSRWVAAAQHRPVDDRCCRMVQPIVALIANDANDLVPFTVQGLTAHALAERS